MSGPIALCSVMTDVSSLEAIDISISYESMRQIIMQSQHSCLVVLDGTSAGSPRGYILKKQLAIELLTGNRPNLERLIVFGPSFAADVSLAEAASGLAASDAHLGSVLSEGRLIGIVTPSDVENALAKSQISEPANRPADKP
ncbi:hypothetical protein [Pseudomonas sp. D(2018)]|uniref:hypothetical protein n=1 Tax=Pseudomonas sp. D(2018) TaxID=2502238 RepID=UPI0010F89106|nr:hypothetical protein [Pseudomonas sp. D(2018)]